MHRVRGGRAKNQKMSELLPFANPALPLKSGRQSVYPYYAGFSDEFALDAIKWVSEGTRNPIILDPWNGAGTTTRVGQLRKLRTIGFDLNPAMVIVAKAELCVESDALIAKPLSRKVSDYFSTQQSSLRNQRLATFFTDATSRYIFDIAMAIWLHLVDHKSPKDSNGSAANISPVPALLFVALFNVSRHLLSSLGTSNPTWIRIPGKLEPRVATTRAKLNFLFREEVIRLSDLIISRGAPQREKELSRIGIADSRNIPLKEKSVNGIVTSPPYCTRLDYGRSTIVELAILESVGLADYEGARSQLIGTSVITTKEILPPKAQWGDTCQKLLYDIYHHPSRASQGYYYKSHFSYFDGLASSIAEVARVLKTSGRACIVVQDSYYKNIHTDLPRILTEMAQNVALNKKHEFRFEKQRSLCSINRGSKAYRMNRKPTETAILFEKVDQ